MMFGDRIRECRVVAGETQDELGALAHVSQRTISSWEKGLREPPYETLLFFCKHFGVSADYMLGLSDRRETDAGGSKAKFAACPDFPDFPADAIPKSKSDMQMFMRGYEYGRAVAAQM